MRLTRILIIYMLSTGCSPIDINHLEIGVTNKQVLIFVDNYQHSKKNEKLVDDYFCGLLEGNSKLHNVNVYRTSRLTNIETIKKNPRIIHRTPLFWGKSCADDFMWLYSNAPPGINLRKVVFSNSDGFVKQTNFKYFSCFNDK